MATRTLSNGTHHGDSALRVTRFADIPGAIDIPVGGGQAEDVVEVSLEELNEDPTELCDLLENENVAKGYWVIIALAYAKQQKVDLAVEIVNKALGAVRGKSEEKLSLYNCLCWLHLLKAREAPRMKFDAKADSDVKTKDFYFRAATAVLNDASRISPSYPPLSLARGVLCLLRATLIQDQTEKTEMLRQALKCFDDALRSSKNKNMFAYLGRARAQYSLGKFGDALVSYQRVLEQAPEMSDPDPRIGIGCCFWALGHRDDAQYAWQRALEINPESTIANLLVGLYHVNSGYQYGYRDPKFKTEYKTGMVTYTQKAWKLNNMMPLANSTFGTYFMNLRNWDTMDKLARRAIEHTDVNAIASDGWYLLGRMEHEAEDLARASDFYSRADQARGGDERGWLPAKLGVAQIKVLQNDLADAKYRLEKIVEKSKNIEALSLLGGLYAEEAFSPAIGTLPEDIRASARKAISHLETVRMAWKDPKRNLTPDSSILLKLARLYEVENPERSFQCLQQVEEMELEDLPDELKLANGTDEAATKSALRENLPPQLLNNLACFHYQSDRLDQARELFQSALNGCIKLGSKDPTIDTDVLITTISYNLARTYEALGMMDDAKNVLTGLLQRHPDYTDARVRLTYIALRQSPGDEGPKAMAQLYETSSSNMEVRALFGWYIRKAKKKTTNVAEDQEQRHYKHTLQGHDKHDCYSLTGMGNLYLAHAREMPRNNDQEKDRRRKMYERAIEFFDKALQLDPHNAYAAQGIGIAVVEDKKDFDNALQIFTRVKETLKDASVHTNLGHIYCELKQYSRAIENYEAALSKDRARDPQILACLGRAWLSRGKLDRSLTSLRTALDYSTRALEVAPDQPHFQFNVAFVQLQIAQLVYSLPETQRTLADVTSAATGLDSAIDALSTIAKHPNPPFPKHDIEQRANMGRNTMRKQLERAAQSQREYEEKNAHRLQAAREQRDAEIARRAEEKRKAEEAIEEQKRKIAEERQKMQERDRELAAARQEEERRRDKEKEDEFSVDEETGERVKKVRTKRAPAKRKKKAGEAAESDLDGEEQSERRRSRTGSQGPGEDGEERPRKKKKRKLERRAPAEKVNSKYKSSERVVDSDEDDDVMPALNDDDEDGENGVNGHDEADADALNGNGAVADEDGGEDDAPVSRRKATRVVDDDDEDGDGDADLFGDDAAGAAGGSGGPDVMDEDE